MMSQPFALLDEVRKTLNSITSSEPGALKVEQPQASVVTTTFGVVMPAAGQFVLFFGALLFLPHLPGADQDDGRHAVRP